MKVRYYNFSEILKRYRNSFNSEMQRISLREDDPEFEGYLEGFESEFARFIGKRYAVGVHSGTAALQLSLVAAGIRPGDEVITTSNTFIGTALAVSNIGAVPVFADINPLTFNIDPADAERRVSDRTKAIIPVHLYGNPCKMDAIAEIAEKHGLKIIEDCCQAHGAEYKGKRVGSFGTAGCFSFYTYKVVGGFGNGGIITTDDADIARRLRELRDPESNTENVLLSHRTPCYLDAVQIAFIRSKLKDIEWIIRKRQSNAKLYSKLLEEADIILPRSGEGVRHVFSSYVIRARERNELRDYLLNHGIETEIEYRIPIHMTNIFGNGKPKLPFTERVSEQMLSLPVNEFVKPEEIRYICESIGGFLRR